MGKPIAFITTKLFEPDTFEGTAESDVLAQLEQLLDLLGIPYIDHFDGKIGDRTRVEQYNYLANASCVQIIMTQKLLDSYETCQQVDRALNIKDTYAKKGKKFPLLVVYASKCNYLARFPDLNQYMNGIPWPVDPFGGKSYFEMSASMRQRQLDRFVVDTREIYKSLEGE